MGIVKKLSRKIVTLPHLTRAAREDGALTDDQDIQAVIRKVRASEVMAHLGVPKNIFRLQTDRREDETEEEQRERLRLAMAEDDTILQDSLRMNDRQARVIVHLGTVHVVAPGEDPQIVALDNTQDADALTPNDLGDDFAVLHNAIIHFNSLPYSTLTPVPLQEGEGMDSFLGEPVADHDEPDGGTVRDDAREATGN